jgi:tetratricopeptide (TPR) repeat protein
MSNLANSMEPVLLSLKINMQGVAISQRAHYRAILNWLSKHKPSPDATNLEQVRGYLETCYHLFQLEDWERANQILLVQVPGSTEDLDDALGTWGAYLEQIHLYEQLLDKLDPSRNIALLNGLGNAYDAVGKFQTAIVYYQTALEELNDLDQLRLQSITLSNLGSTYSSLGDYQSAISVLNQALEIACSQEDEHTLYSAIWVTSTWG